MKSEPHQPLTLLDTTDTQDCTICTILTDQTSHTKLTKNQSDLPDHQAEDQLAAEIDVPPPKKADNLRRLASSRGGALCSLHKMTHGPSELLNSFTPVFISIMAAVSILT